jgi:hypothetical protein
MHTTIQMRKSGLSGERGIKKEFDGMIKCRVLRNMKSSNVSSGRQCIKNC